MRNHTIATALSLLVLAASCQKDGETGPAKVESITIVPETLELTVGDEYGLTLEYTPENAEDKTASWTSSAPGIAIVDKSGKVRGVTPGEATITAKCGEAEAECKVTVVEIQAESIVLNMTEAKIKVDETVKLEATVLPEDTADKTVNWTSSDPETALVIADGTVTGVAPGTVTITAKCGNAEATCEVEVLAIPVTSLTIDPEEKEIEVGDIFQISATVLPENATDKTVTWVSSDPDVASVDAQGVVTGKQEGTATITASAGDIQKTCSVTVTKAEESEEPIADIKQDWTIGELFDYPEYGKGIVFETGENFIKVVAFVEQGNYLTYSNLGVSPICTDTNLEDGKSVTDKIEEAGLLASYPAIGWARSKGEFWYLPTLVELYNLYNQSDVINSALISNGSPELPIQVWSCIESSSDTNRVYAYVTGSPRAYLRTQACESVAVMKLRFK